MRPTSTASQPLRVAYLREPEVSVQLDGELRELIAGCPLTERAGPEGPVDLRGPLF